MFYNSTGSLPATNAMSAVSRFRVSDLIPLPRLTDFDEIIIFMDAFSAVTIMASASRQMFAFARDQGTPFASWLARVSTSYRPHEKSQAKPATRSIYAWVYL